ncbi:LuxR C-terminal-related transcriptional regulator [Nonomuraea sp. NPDC050786]|uniref:helix-turn-helix transcriptional regulator n=1 Tax=Nonomuraea sp. NPDC050786 TaxID=3154840 RepID=UPI0033E738B5
MLAGDEDPDEMRQHLVQQLWDIATAHVVGLLTEAVPVHLAASWAAANERTRLIMELNAQYASMLTAQLGALRSITMDDATARRTAIDLAAAALIELQSAANQDLAAVEETAPEAFACLADSLSLLTRYSNVELELAGPERSMRVLPADVAQAARATVRDAVLLLLDHGGVGRVRVAWRVEESSLQVSVRDDGPGRLSLDTPAVRRISDRVLGLNGALDVDPVPNWGTAVTAVLPLTPPEVPDAHPLSVLNPRELDVLELLILGWRNRQIATHLHISEHTVKFHVANILSKLQVESRGEAAAVARDAGLPSRFSATKLST